VVRQVQAARGRDTNQLWTGLQIMDQRMEYHGLVAWTDLTVTP